MYRNELILPEDKHYVLRRDSDHTKADFAYFATLIVSY